MSIKPKALSRRKFINQAAATGVVTLGLPTLIPMASNFFRKSSYNKHDTVVFGINVSQSGFFAEEGLEQLRAYKLAIKHINHGGGMLETLRPLALNGQGLLGKKVEYVVADTKGSPKETQKNSQRMIKKDGAILLCGGSDSAAALAQQRVAQKTDKLFMSGLSHSNECTGNQRSQHGFRHFFNSYQGSMALCPFLAKKYGGDRVAAHITVDYSWGGEQYNSMKMFTEKEGWLTANNFVVRHNQQSYSSTMQKVIESNADIVVLNLYGIDLQKALKEIANLKMRDRQVNGRHFQVVVPFYTELMAQKIGYRLFEGIYTPMNWHWSLSDLPSKLFVKSFVDEYGLPPTQSAHTSYVQTLVYANAVQLVGTFDATKVIQQLENFVVDGVGNGQVWYRGSDHQAFHDLYIATVERPATPKEYKLSLVQSIAGKNLVYNDQMGPFAIRASNGLI